MHPLKIQHIVKIAKFLSQKFVTGRNNIITVTKFISENFVTVTTCLLENIMNAKILTLIICDQPFKLHDRQEYLLCGKEEIFALKFCD